ncbi:MAG TPA: thiamine phosphate synthase [Acidisarcina sp.]|nr:thiamine phosphate synthase [Acidisarcina sp.]
MAYTISPLYPILDASLLPLEDRSGFVTRLAGELLDAGVSLLQYRNKTGSDREVLEDVAMLRHLLPAGRCVLILNDRPDLAVLGGFDGVHVGQQDLSPDAARGIVGKGRVVGVSTHNAEQLRMAAEAPVDYIAIGPIFPTASKQNPDPVVGLEGIRLARSLTSRPLVAIGGITLENCSQVKEAGADSIAVISSLFQSPSGESPAKVARDFLARFR